MRAGGGKQKGGQFEREVCKLLSSWISGGKRTDIFWRSAMSGGRATVLAKNGHSANAQLGDITAIDPIGHILTDKFIIECKYYKNLKLDQLVYNTHEGFVRTIWDSLKELARLNQKQPMLIAKQNGKPIIVGLDSGGKDRVETIENKVKQTFLGEALCEFNMDDLIFYPIEIVPCQEKGFF